MKILHALLRSARMKVRVMIKNCTIIDYCVLVFCLAFSWWLMHHSFQYKDGQFVVLGRVWSDFAAHIPLIRSFSLGWNFPTEYPTFPGEPIRYHYLFFLSVGLLERVGFNIALAFNLLSALGFALLMWMIYQYCILFFNSRVTGILAIGLFLFNGTLSFLEYFKTSNNLSTFITQIISAREYASFGPWDGRIVSAFWNWNIYANQRHLAISFGLALAVAYPLIRKTIEKKYTITKPIVMFIYISFVLFPLLHQAGYIMLVGIVFFWGVIHCRSLPRRLLLVYVISFAASLITLFLFTENSKQPITLKFGYLAREVPSFESMKESFENVKISVQAITFYWFHNLGLYTLFVPIAWIFSSRKVKLFLIPFFGYFILANTFQLSTDMINNHKLINFTIIGCNILVAGFLIKALKSHLLFLPLILPIVFLLTFSGIADAVPFITNHYHYIDDYPKSEVMGWIKENTPTNSVFLTNTYIYNPASLAGRKIFLDYGYFNWSMGYPDRERRATLPLLFSPTIEKETLCTELTKQHLTHLLVSPGRGDPDTGVAIDGSQLTLLGTSVFLSQDGHEVYDLRPICE